METAPTQPKLLPLPQSRRRRPALPHRRATSSPDPDPPPPGDLPPQLSSSIHQWKPQPLSSTLPPTHPWMDGWMDGCGAAGAGPAPTCGTSSRSAMEAGRIGIHRLLSPRCGAAHHTGACCCGGPRRRRISDDLDAQDPTPLPSFLVSTGTARGRRTCTCWTRSWRTNLDMSSSSSLPLPCHGQSAKLGHMPRSPAHCHIRWSVVCACHLQQQDDPTHLFRCYYCSAPCIYPAKERRCRSGWLLLRRAVDDPDIRLPATTSCRKFFYWLCRNGVQSSCYHDYPIRRGKSFIGSVKTGFTPHVIMIFPPGEGSAGTMKPMSRPTHLHLDGYSFFAVRMDYSEVNAKQQGSPAPRLLRPMRSSDRFVFGSGLAS